MSAQLVAKLVQAAKADGLQHADFKRSYTRCEWSCTYWLVRLGDVVPGPNASRALSKRPPTSIVEPALCLIPLPVHLATNQVKGRENMLEQW
eukprot:5957128-Amphidinium_carterae.1